MKKLLKVLAALVVLVVVLLVAVFFYIDSIAKKAIETGATYALGVQTTLRRANIGILSGEFSLTGLQVANPEGFSSERFMTLGTGELAVTMRSLTKDTVEVPRLALDDIEMTLEKKGGESNYKVILKNLKRFQSAEKKDQDAGKPEKGKQFIVHEIVITNVLVHAQLFGIGGRLDSVQVPLDEIRLTEVGSEGLTASQMTDIIIQAIMAGVLKSGADFPADLVSDLGGAMKGLEGLSDMGIKAAFDLGGTGVEGLKGAEGIGKAAEGVSKEIEKGLGGLFGGKKDE